MSKEDEQCTDIIHNFVGFIDNYGDEKLSRKRLSTEPANFSSGHREALTTVKQALTVNREMIVGAVRGAVIADLLILMESSIEDMRDTISSIERHANELAREGQVKKATAHDEAANKLRRKIFQVRDCEKTITDYLDEFLDTSALKDHTTH